MGALTVDFYKADVEITNSRMYSFALPFFDGPSAGRSPLVRVFVNPDRVSCSNLDSHSIHSKYFQLELSNRLRVLGYLNGWSQ